MKILFITDLYPIKSSETTTPVTLHNFVIEWIKQGHSVNVIKPNFVLNSLVRGKTIYLDGIYEYGGVKICNLNYFTPFWFNVLKKVPKEIKFADYDVIIAHMPCGLIYGNKVAAIMRKPFVCGVHCSDMEVLSNPFYGFYFKEQMEKAYKRAIKIACRSFVLKDKFDFSMPQFAEKTFVAPSGINSNIISNHITASAIKMAPVIKVITCANLVKRKNIDKLVLAMKDLRGFELKVIGDGPELNRLKQIAPVNVKFLGRLPHEKVLQEMKQSHVFILPSINETFGMVYLEAMASGCITIGTKNDGIDGIIKDSENGFLCEPTVESIQQVLLKIKHHSSIERLSRNSIETVKMYTKEICAQNYLIKICEK